MNYEEALIKLTKYNQTHILKYYNQLNELEKNNLLLQIEQINFTNINNIKNNEVVERRKIEPINVLSMDKIKNLKEHYVTVGHKAIRENRVGLVLLAGGAGTRLGSEKPKGAFNIGITRDIYIFERIIDNIMIIVNETSTWIHLFVMTSDKNHEDTVAFLSKKNYFGYHKDYIHFYKQDMLPITDFNGRILLEEKGRIAMSPNGNGGWFSSLINSDCYKILNESGIEWINVFAVDNVLQSIADPSYIGAVISENYLAGAKVVKKNNPNEKLGVMCLEDGKVSVIEYFDLTDEMRNKVNHKGELLYNYGTILNYMFKIDVLYSILNKELPVHLVEKRGKYINEMGFLVEPDRPNCYKYETLVLDIIHMLDKCLLFEVDRDSEFAPIKNLYGIDSVESAQKLLLTNGISL